MTSARRTISRGALLVALTAGSSALTGGAAYADVLGGTGVVPLPAPLPTVPLLAEPSPTQSPTPAPSAAPTTSPSPTPTAQQSTTSSGTTQPDTSGPAADGGSTDPSTAQAPTSVTAAEEVSASNATAPAPVAAPAAAPVTQQPTVSRPAAAGPVRVAVPTAPVLGRPAVSHVNTAGTTGAQAPHAADGLGLVDAASTSALPSFSGFPQLTAGSLQLPSMPLLPGLQPMVAPRSASGLAPLLAGGTSTNGARLPMVRTGHSAPVQPGSTGVVLFVMASAAGAAGLARVHIYRQRVIHG